MRKRRSITTTKSPYTMLLHLSHILFKILSHKTYISTNIIYIYKAKKKNINKVYMIKVKRRYKSCSGTLQAFHNTKLYKTHTVKKSN